MSVRWLSIPAASSQSYLCRHVGEPANIPRGEPVNGQRRVCLHDRILSRGWLIATKLFSSAACFDLRVMARPPTIGDLRSKVDRHLQRVRAEQACLRLRMLVQTARSVILVPWGSTDPQNQQLATSLIDGWDIATYALATPAADHVDRASSASAKLWPGLFDRR
jgi:hypothetical protein